VEKVRRDNAAFLLKTKWTVPLRAVAGIALLLKILPVRMDRLSGDLRLIRSAGWRVRSECCIASALLAFRTSTDLQHNKEQIGEYPISCPILAFVRRAGEKPAWLIRKITFAYRTKRFNIRGTVSRPEIASFWHPEYQVYRRGTKPSARSKGWITASFSVKIQSSE